jgi:hypothetical protein
MEHTVLRHLTSECLLIDAYIAWQRRDDERCAQLLGAGLLRAQETDYCFWFRWVPQVLPVLCAKALSIGLQPGFVQDVIRRFQLAPPRGSAAALAMGAQGHNLRASLTGTRRHTR